MDKDTALRLALEALEANDLLVNGTEKSGGLVWCMDGYYSDCFDIEPINKQTEEAITAIKAALEESKQKWINLTLTEIEILFIQNTTPKSTAIDFARAIESRLKEKNI